MGNYALFVAPHLDKKEHEFRQLLTHAPFVVPNHLNGGKEEMSTM